MPPKPSIPAWQRVQPPKPSAIEEPANNIESTEEPEDTQTTEDGTLPSDSDSDESPGPTEHSVSSQLDQVDALLQEASLKDASNEKKRAFLESKKIPEETIDRTVTVTQPTASSKEVSNFQQPSQAQQKPISQTSNNVVPPIITYPEFLVEAHKPPPLITPGRLLGASYFVGGLATLIYAANKSIVEPMVEALSDARHDFASHNQAKLDEFNERLSKIVSKIPETKPDALMENDISEVDSITSDPTELYHRDMGTQTSPLPSRRPSLPAADDDSLQASVTRHTSDLDAIKTQLAQLADSMENSKESETERQDSFNRLRSYLDTLIYNTPAINLWTNTEDTSATKKGSEVDDGIEELKKEIRGVKGVLLSARRFPSAGRVA